MVDWLWHQTTNSQCDQFSKGEIANSEMRDALSDINWITCCLDQNHTKMVQTFVIMLRGSTGLCHDMYLTYEIASKDVSFSAVITLT